MDYTVEMYKLDRRTKTGRRMVYKQDYKGVTLEQMERMYPKQSGYVHVFHETYVTRKNLMTGKEFQERYDTPYTASASSEAYWSQ